VTSSRRCSCVSSVATCEGAEVVWIVATRCSLGESVNGTFLVSLARFSSCAGASMPFTGCTIGARLQALGTMTPSTRSDVEAAK